MKNKNKRKVLITVIVLVVISILFVSAGPVFGKPTPFQVTLNSVMNLVPINIGGQQIKITFEGDYWRGQLNGKDLLAGECKIYENPDGAVMTLKQQYTCADSGQVNPITKKPIALWIETPGPEMYFEYKKGPPATVLPTTADKVPQAADGATGADKSK